MMQLCLFDEPPVAVSPLEPQPSYVDPGPLEPWFDDEGNRHTHMTFRPPPEHEPMISSRIILSLFDVSGEWSRPYREAGYQVAHLDIQNAYMPCDIMEIDGPQWFDDFDLCNVWGILAALPCTDFAVSGARWFTEKDADGRTDASVALALRTMAIIGHLRPAWWALENPVGRLNRLVPELAEYGPWYWQPHDYGDPYTKKTGLWGEFNNNLPLNPVEPTEGSKMHRLPPSEDRAYLRSITPTGFARAFFEVNR